MAVTSAKIRAREAATGKKAYTAIDNAGNLHYAFDNATLQSIVQKANVAFSDQQSAKAYNQALEQSSANNQFNADQAQKQMDFQERMSSTAHQREVKDLIAAGLNPVLSANGGASTPVGASASADTSTASLKAQMYMQQLNAGVQLAVNRQNIESAQKMAKWQNDLNREIAYAQLYNNEAVANIQAAASMYGADQASSASRYGADRSFTASRTNNRENNRIQKYMYSHPNTLSGSVFRGLNSVFANTAKSFEKMQSYSKLFVDSAIANAQRRAKHKR